MIYLGADHNGYNLKEKIKKYLGKRGLAYVDLGPALFDKDDDYPDYALAVGKQVSRSERAKGILVCGTGNGMAIAANKVKGIRAAIVWNPSIAKKAVQDDHANVMALPAWFLSEKQILAIVRVWLAAKPSRAKRHLRRVGKVNNLDNAK